MNIKYKKLHLSPGKSAFHRFNLNGKDLNPCICDYNIDFTTGCIANVNPYFRTGEEIISGDILKLPRDQVLGRLDETVAKVQKELDPKLKTHLPKTKDFSESLKGKIWKILEKHVASYQGETGKRRNPDFLNKYFSNGAGLLDGFLNGCTYCYAGYKNNNQNVSVEKADFSDVDKELEKIVRTEEHKAKYLKPVPIIRLGKSVEAASMFHLNQLIELLELGKKHGARFHIPTKMLPYDKTIAKLLIETQSSVGYSFAYEKLEDGVVLFGFDNQHRLDVMTQYADAGVTTLARMALDCSQSFEHCEKQGGQILEIKDHLEKHPNIGRQLIPMRMRKLSDVVAMTGLGKQTLTAKTDDMFENIPNGWETTKNGEIRSTFMHPDFYNFLHDGKSLHVCADFGDTFHCDSCQLKGMPQNWTIDRKHHIPPVMQDKEKWGAYRTRKKKEALALERKQDDIKSGQSSLDI